MKKYLQIIQKNSLFYGISEAEIESALKCMSVFSATYSRGEFVLRYGEKTSSMRLVLSGSVHIVQEDFWGNSNIVAKISEGELFAESYACAADFPLRISAVAAEKSEIMSLDVQKILTTCTSVCEFHGKIIRNFVSILAKKNLLLRDKLEYVTERTTEKKLLSYLSAESIKQGSRTFNIPFNRGQLADYLSVDRSAMSNELCKLRDKGVLNFEKNRFQLL